MWWATRATATLSSATYPQEVRRSCWQSSIETLKSTGTWICGRRAKCPLASGWIAGWRNTPPPRFGPPHWRDTGDTSSGTSSPAWETSRWERLPPKISDSCTGSFRSTAAAAAQENLIARNPTDGIILPRKKAAPKQVLNNAQLERFMTAIQEDKVWHDFFYTELTTGLRRGEICGLMWQDFDEAHGTLTVRRTIHAERGGRLTAGETKTGAGKRIITLPPSTAQFLSERRKRSYTEWIFPDPLRPERPTRPNAAYVRMKELLKKAGLPSIRFHDLRHTFATHALASGVDAKTLSGILGHTQASFTLDTYTHVTGDMQKRASEIVGGFMENIMVR